jgi:putative FmdB family regulatory protein
MPIYEYRRPDGTTFEVVQSFSDEPLTVDPETGVPVERVLHAPAVHFKGKGFYNTDYGTRARQRETAAAAEGSSGSDSSSAQREKSGDSAAGERKGAGESTGTGEHGGAGERAAKAKGSGSGGGASSKPVPASG